MVLTAKLPAKFGVKVEPITELIKACKYVLDAVPLQKRKEFIRVISKKKGEKVVAFRVRHMPNYTGEKNLKKWLTKKGIGNTKAQQRFFEESINNYKNLFLCRNPKLLISTRYCKQIERSKRREEIGSHSRTPSCSQDQEIGRGK